MNNRNHRRKPTRLECWDYHDYAIYFITTVTHKRTQVFGQVENGTIHLSLAGEMIAALWLELESRYARIELLDFVIMPNHVHGLIHIKGMSYSEPNKASLGDMMKWFKTMTTNAYIRGVRTEGWPRFDGKLWQPEYWEHIVRNDSDLTRIEEYIFNNPWEWDDDPDNAVSDEAWRP